MKEWIREAGITKNITFHSYRRTYATLQGAAGTDIRTIQSNMAHKSITTTQRYMKVVDSNKREASNRISFNPQVRIKVQIIPVFTAQSMIFCIKSYSERIFS